MDYKEFYYWLDGFMTNRDWTVIREIDIETIQEKLKEVKSDGIDVNKIINLRKEVHIPINTEISNPFKDND
jgi:hypothetical protein